MKICLFGGTFDPVHNGHIKFAQHVEEFLSLDKLIFIPSFMAPHKQTFKATDPKHRLNMLEIAVSDHDKWLVNDYEILNEGVSYSIHTIKHIKKIFGKSHIYYFLIGADNLLIMKKWKEYENLLQMITFVVTPRDGVDIESVDREILKKVTRLPIAVMDISSTEIREKIGKNMAFDSLLPANVTDYILSTPPQAHN